MYDLVDRILNAEIPAFVSSPPPPPPGYRPLRAQQRGAHPVMVMISPETRHNFLFSSRTVFMDSIHRASTGPSNTTHLRATDVSYAACDSRGRP